MILSLQKQKRKRLFLSPPSGGQGVSISVLLKGNPTTKFLLRMHSGVKLNPLPPTESRPEIRKSGAHRLNLVIPEALRVPSLAGLPRDKTLILTKIRAPRMKDRI